MNSEEIDKLSTLIDRLRLEPNVYMGRIEEDENQGIIYGIDSDNEDPNFRMENQDETHQTNETKPLKPHGKDPEGSGKEHENNSQPSFQDYYNFDESFKNYAYNNNYNYIAPNKLVKEIPPAFLEKERNIVSGILNIDCASNQEELILVWINQLKLLISTGDSTFANMNLGDFVTYIQYKTTGKIAGWIKNTDKVNVPQDVKESKRTDAKISYINFLANEIYKEFVGFDRENPPEMFKKEAIIEALSNMRLCDPCLLESFFCQAESYYYESYDSDNSRKPLLDIIMSKLPEPMIKYIREQKLSKYSNESMTLGKLKLLAIEYRKDLCIRKKEQTYIQNVKTTCCGKLEEVPQQYGCQKPRYRNYSKHSKYRSYHPYKSYKKNFRSKFIRYKTHRRPWKPRYQKRFRKQTDRPPCPKGKKNCKCFLCHEEGHYANECPNKKTNHKLNYIYSLGFEPIEEKYLPNQIIDFDTYSLESSENSDYTEDYNSENSYESEASK